MRTVSTAVMALLMVAALFFGNCFSCPQMLLSSASQQHDCCPGQHPASAHCQTQDLQHFVKAASGTHLGVLAVFAGITESPMVIVPLEATVTMVAAADPIPPGILSLRI